MKYIIDRFEDIYAVCEDESGNMHNIFKEKLPSNAKEGEVISQNSDGTYSIDETETSKRKKYIEDLFNSL